MMFMPELQRSEAFEWTQAAGGRVLQCVPLLGHAPHLFTTRDLQLRDDEGEWSAVAAAMGVPPSRLRLIRQVHGTDVAVARAGVEVPVNRPEADVIVTNDPSIAIAVRVADCAPILLADTRLGVVAAAHAGWRGAARGAAAKAVLALGEQFGSQPADLIAAIGPCLGPCCGEVGPEVADAFRDAGHAADDVKRWFAPGAGDRSLLDLGGANVDQLVRAGVPRARIYDSAICTKSHAQVFHSYRAAGAAAGRMAAAIRMTEEGRRRKEEG
jgi:YfiH family protein